MEQHETRRAAALQYDPEASGAPVLAAFGEGHVADKIVETAVKSGVPLYPDKELAAVLAQLSVGDEIPAELYEVVAKVMLFISEADKSYGDRLRTKLEG